MDGAIGALEKALARLPGFGRRSAARAAIAVARDGAALGDPLAAALRAVRERVRKCSRCGGFTETGSDPCALCSDPLRDGSLLCVVEDAADIATIEASGAFKGRYHSLGGKAFAGRNSDAARRAVAALADRVSREGVREVLLALSTDMDGDATALYAAEALEGTGVRVTRLAFGLPADSAVAYSDPLTLRRAIAYRVRQRGGEAADG